jgi:hypothetical protein
LNNYLVNSIKNTKNEINKEKMETTILKISQMLKEINEYITKVIKKEVESDEKLGIYLLETIRSFPLEVLNKILSENTQDLLMVIYLTNFAVSQVKTGENLKINVSNK